MKSTASPLHAPDPSDFYYGRTQLVTTRDPDLAGIPVRYLALLAAKCGNRGWCYAKQADLATELGVTTRSCIRAEGLLRSKGLLVKMPYRWRFHFYFVASQYRLELKDDLRLPHPVDGLRWSEEQLRFWIQEVTPMSPFRIRKYEDRGWDRLGFKRASREEIPKLKGDTESTDSEEIQRSSSDTHVTSRGSSSDTHVTSPNLPSETKDLKHQQQRSSPSSPPPLPVEDTVRDKGSETAAPRELSEAMRLVQEVSARILARYKPATTPEPEVVEATEVKREEPVPDDDEEVEEPQVAAQGTLVLDPVAVEQVKRLRQERARAGASRLEGWVYGRPLGSHIREDGRAIDESMTRLYPNGS